MKFTRNKDDVLIVGGDSVIGSYLYTLYKSQGVDVFKTSRRSNNPSDIYLDLEVDYSYLDLSNVKKAFICAAITSIEKCEKDQIKSYKINVEKTKKLINYLIDNNVFIIFLSTSFVYNGDEISQPKCLYGKQKLLIENFLKNYESSSCIVRLSKIVHNNMLLFNSWIYDLRNGKSIYAFHDMFFSPINIEYAANCLKKLEEISYYGIINISAIDEISYYDAAKYFAMKLNLDMSKIIPISYKEKNVNYYQKYTTLDLSALSLLEISLQSSYSSLDFLLKNGDLSL